MNKRDALEDLDDDIRDHLERETADHIARGMAPDEARAAARRAFGSTAIAKEDTRAVWTPLWIDQLLQDLRYGLRTFVRAPGFTSVVVLTLAIGIGLNTAVFSVVNAVLMRPLAYVSPERLVWVSTYDNRSPIEWVASPDVIAFRDGSTTLDRVAAFDIQMERVATKSEVAATRVAAVSHEFWELAGVPPALGRVPAVEEDAVVLSHAFFEHAFGGDPAIVGTPITVEGRQTLVAGVAPPGFHAQLPPPPSVSQLQPGEIDLYHAIAVQPPAANAMGVRLYNVLARVKPGVAPEQVAAELETLHAGVMRANARRMPTSHVRVVPFGDKLTGRARTPLLILLAAVAAVLAIACANIANLLLARASARQKEVAIRAALGAGRGRVLRQFLVESLILAAAGGAAGLFVARASLGVMLRLIPYAVPRLVETTIDGRVLAFAAVAATVTALVCGATPAIALWHTGVHDALKHGGRTATIAAGGLRVRRILVASEIALAAVLLVGAALLVRSFWRITAYPPGFAPDRVLTMRFQFSGPKYREVQARRRYVDELLDRAGTAPGVEAVGVSTGGANRIVLIVEGEPLQAIQDRPSVTMSVASPGYADAIGMRVVKGRWLQRSAEPEYVINEALARRYFADTDPIGRRILLPMGPDPKNARYVPVVGVAADLRYSDLEAAAEPELFISYEHANPFGMHVAMRTAGDPARAAAAVRARLAGIDSTLPLFEVKPLDAALAESIAPRRFNTVLLGAFAASALLLAVLGIYGVIAYSVAQRTHEIGVRMALGAERRDVVRMVVRQGMTIAVAGIGAGVVGALALTRVMTSLLYGVTPTDPAAFAAGVIALGATALAACAGPAAKAALVDPMVALRCE